MIRKLFNNNWIFSHGTGNALSLLMGTAQNKECRQVTLPHDAMIASERINDPKYAGMGFYRGEDINYRKYFTMSSKDRDKVIWLEFEGVYQNASVYVNGSFAGRCIYGYGSYYIDITKFVRFGDNNEIQVVVRNSPLSGRWYTGGGIYRNVNILTAGRLYIECRGTRISAVSIGDDTAELEVVTPVIYADVYPAECTVLNEIYDAEGHLTAAVSSPVTLSGNDRIDCRQKITLENPYLWSTEAPYLYQCRTTLYLNSRISDTYVSHFGVRRLQLDAKYGLRINGKQVKLRGGCVHHDNGLLGAATFAQAEERRIRKMKEAGYNAVRSAHQPASRAMLEACDRLGMLVMDEFTDAWTTSKADYDYGCSFSQSWEKDVENMVMKDFNHPSVIFYSIGNEIAETGDAFDVAWGRRIVEKIRSIDTTRYTINCINLVVAVMGHVDEILKELGIMEKEETREINTMMTRFGEHMPEVLAHPLISQMTEEAFSQVDVAGYNYAHDRYEKDCEKYPGRIIAGSETWPANLAHNWKIVKKNPRIIGDFSWTAWDYLGEVGCGKVSYEQENAVSFFSSWPWRSAYCGDFNLIGDRRPISYWRQIVWGLRKEPYISVRPPRHHGETPLPSLWSWKSDSVSSWNWPGYEGKPVTVEVFSDADEVELFVNGRSAGKKKAGEEREFCAVFETVYTPGEITAKDSRGNSFSICSAKNERFLSVYTDRTELASGGQEIAFVEISICDEDGVPCPAAEKMITVEVKGEGVLQGLGSGCPVTEEGFADSQCITYEGRALAVIRSGMKSGHITAEVTVEGGGTAEIILEVV